MHRMKRHLWFRLLWLVIGLAVVAGLNSRTAAAQTTPTCDRPKNYINFYTLPDNLTPTDQTGKLLRVEHIRSYTAAEVAQSAGVEVSPYGAEAYRVLYMSRSTPMTPVAVSGTIVVPTGTRPANGFPVIAYAFGTTGMADTCAPSRSEFLIGTSLLPWVASGYIVSATDYAGLGMPGLHPYGIGEVSGRNLLDSARAALNFCDASRQIPQSAANQIFLQGHSQGGHAALFGHQLQATYAPELNLRGSILMAPGAELRLLAERLSGPYPTPVTDATALAMVAYRQYYGAPATLQPWLQEPYATQLPARAEQQCIVGLTSWLGLSPSRIFQPQLLTSIAAGQWSALEPWTTYIDANTPGNFDSDVPIKIIHSQEDLTVPMAVSQRLSERLCRNGTPVSLSRYVDANHITIVKQSRGETVAWMNDRLNDKPFVDYCGDEPSPLDLVPVSLGGAALTNLIGLPVDQIFGYSYVEGNWKSIPLQIDEVTIDGNYTSQEDGLLDANDELVFMAGDFGNQAPVTAQILTDLPISDGWYSVHVSDPADPTLNGWIYIVHSGTLAPALADYVSYDAVKRTVSGKGYAFGLAENGWPNSLVLGDGENILDRFKFRLDCSVASVCPITEEALPAATVGFVKEGGVRAILRSGAMFAYHSQITWSNTISVSALLRGDVRVSTDFTIGASGATFYNENLPGGISIDGIADPVAASPYSPWWQISTENGAIIQIAGTEGSSAALTNYYQDDFVTDSTDTGDQVKFGDSGLLIQKPANSFDLQYSFYVAPGVQPNLGDMVAAAWQRKLITETSFYTRSSFTSLHLPVVQR